MSQTVLVATAAFTCLFAATVSAADQDTAVEYVVQSGYFEKNTVREEANVTPLVITTRAAFDNRFGVAFVNGNDDKFLANDAFDSRMVIAVVRRGDQIWQYQVQSLTANRVTLTLKYKATSKDGAGAKFASPLIVSLPKGKYQSVSFIENGKDIGSVRVEAGEKP